MPKAAVVTDFTKPLEIQNLPIPEPGPGQVLVRMDASGICHTDLHAARGDWPVKPKPPFIPGHEGVGVVEKVGPGAVRKVGDRVAIAWLGSACGHCRYCVSGWETLCMSQQNNGYSVNGGFAAYAVADGDYVGVVPDSVSSQDAAPLTCAGVTTYKAVKVCNVQNTELVSIWGIGGLGHLALQYARITGGVALGVDVVDEKLDLAQELGADYVVNAAKDDPVKAIQKLGGADVAVVVTPNPKVFNQAMLSLRRGGRIVLVALPASPPAGSPGCATLDVPIFETVLGGLTVIGSIVGTRNDLEDVFRLHALGRTKVISQAVSIEDVNHSFDLMLAGKIPARHVITRF